MSSPTTTPEQQPDDSHQHPKPCSRSIAARRVTLDYGLPKYVVPFDVAEEIEHELNRLRDALIRLNNAVVARMSADEPTGEERLELLRASKHASEIIGENETSPSVGATE